MSQTSYNIGVASYTGTNCLCQSVNINKTADEYEAKDASGVTKAYVFANKKETATIELIIASNFTEPTVGSTITVNSNSYYVQSVTVTESNTDFKKCSVTVIRMVDGTLPGSSSASA